MPRQYRTTEDDMTAAQRDDRDRQLDQARRMSDAEAAEFKAKANEACDRAGLPRIA
ncbi:MAG: hypothetical protein ACRDVE_17880 [Actinocrinis sp.]